MVKVVLVQLIKLRHRLLLAAERLDDWHPLNRLIDHAVNITQLAANRFVNAARIPPIDNHP
ncbi:hypothetical protein D3C85_1723090 [compost metagenome]